MSRKEKVIFLLTILYVLGLAHWDYCENIDKRPQPRALYNLGVEYSNAGNFDLAKKYFKWGAEWNKIYGTHFMPHQDPYGIHIDKCRKAYLAYIDEGTALLDEYIKRKRN